MASGYGLADGVKYAEFVFDSSNSTRAHDGQYSPIDWPTFLPGTPVNNVSALKILEVQIPFSYYVFTEENNTFTLLESPTSFAVPLTVTIPPGNYTADNFVSVAGTALTLASGQAGGSNTTYQASFDFANSKITFATLDGAVGFYFKIYMQSPTTLSEPALVHPGPYIGYLDGVLYSSTTANYATHLNVAGTTAIFPTSPTSQLFYGAVGQEVLLPDVALMTAGQYFIIYNVGSVAITVKTAFAVLIYAQPTGTRVTYTINGGGTAWIRGASTAYSGGLVPPEGQASLTAPNVMNLSGPNYLYLCSSQLGPLVDVFLPNERLNGNELGSKGPELAKVPVEVNSGNIIFWSDPDPSKWFDLDNLQSLPSLDFYCSIGINNENKPIRFNGQGFSIKMGVLIGDPNVTALVGGGAENNRVYKRTWKPSSLY
jgi:hypothetical protein